jgi:hypothetical protein
MEEHQDHKQISKNIPKPPNKSEQYAIEGDSDTLVPFEDENEHREINTDDPGEISYWAQEFQISEDELKSAIVMNGHSLRAIKKYLSV